MSKEALYAIGAVVVALAAGLGARKALTAPIEAKTADEIVPRALDQTFTGFSLAAIGLIAGALAIGFTIAAFERQRRVA